MEFVSPEQYAAYLATYIASPTKIESLVGLTFTRVPSLRKIADMRYKVEQARKRERNLGFVRGDPARDGEDWQPDTFVPKIKPRRYVNSRIVYTPVHIELPPCGELPVIRCHTDVVRAVAIAFGLTYADLVGRRRTTGLVAARAVAARILIERGNTVANTGRYIGRDHSSILNLTNNFDDRCKRFPEIRTVYDRLTAKEAA